jgi:3,4-dihydroxy 2-butanone 4-phosphate synthase/GTP cyclohydrolase II
MNVMRTAWPWLRVLIGVGILGVLLGQLGTDAFLDGVRVVDMTAVFAALGIGLVTTVLSAWRWCLVARRLGLSLSLRDAVRDYYRALFLNAVLPAGVLGDVHRAVRHGQHASDLGGGVRAVVLERAAGQVVIVAAGVTVLLTEPSVVPIELQDVVAIAGTVVAALAVAVLAGGFLMGRNLGRESKLGRALAVTLADVRRGLVGADATVGVLSLSAATLAGHLTLFVVAARAAGVTAPAADLVPLMVLALLAMSLPVNIGGWGPREGVSAVVFGAAGLGAAQGLTVAVVYGVLAMIASLPGAGILVFKSVAGLRSAPGLRGVARLRPLRTSARRPDPADLPRAGVGRAA